MRYILLLGLLGLIACENDEFGSAVSFSGQVTDNDSDNKPPLVGAKIDLLVQTSLGIDTILSSTITDSKGKYRFQVEALDDRFEYFKVDISDEYYKRCTELLTPDMTSSGHKAIERHSLNVWNLNSCVTGKIETIISKQSPLTKDTLNIVVGTKYPNGTYLFVSDPISVTGNKQWTKDYYFNVVRSVKYLIELKKENGDIISWTEERELKPKETIGLNIEF